jgi:hypothetical protein
LSVRESVQPRRNIKKGNDGTVRTRKNNVEKHFQYTHDNEKKAAEEAFMEEPVAKERT